MKQWYCYEPAGENKLRLLRVFGDAPSAKLPEHIKGYPVWEIGAYCFAGTSHVEACMLAGPGKSGSEKMSFEQVKAYLQHENVTELGGKYLQGISLPDSVQGLGNLAFYQCSCLEEIQFGTALAQIGSDAFMNCSALKRFVLRGGIADKSGLRQILAQRSQKTTVVFQKTVKKNIRPEGENGKTQAFPESGMGDAWKGRTEAVLVYPEFYETYDEIGPAHIFALNIDGEGFRARQCFQDGVVDLEQYDRVFASDCPAESEKTLCQIAMNRLYYPVQLQCRQEQSYWRYLKQHARFLGSMLLADRNLEWFYWFGAQGLFTQEQMKQFLVEQTAARWTEGIGALMQYQNEWFEEGNGDEYGFDEF
ncbi:MAG: leucine-rich repeat domain-containing protein [Clostridiaceae bacterium]|nr:leucine-rich repeat domain-containing protein [Clostridiaceae bacterium]